MKNKVLYQDQNLKLEYVDNGKYLHETWRGITPGEVFLNLLNIIIKYLYKKKCDGLLLDARQHKGLSPQSQELAARLHKEYAHEHGSLKQAIVVPDDIFSKFSVDNYSKQFKEDHLVEIRYFNNLDSAKEWLESKD